MDSKTILVVDDNEACREAMLASLTHAGFRVYGAADGCEGVEAVRRLQPDVVFMDLMMPEMDGWEAMAALRADPGTAAFAVVACTASAPDPDRIQAAGFRGCLPKPTRLPALVAAIRQHG
jgi:hypothetical protein